MIETVTTMVSLMLSAGAAGVIGMSLWEDRTALHHALAGTGGRMAPLPPHTHRVAGPRPARFIWMAVPVSPLRAAA